MKGKKGFQKGHPNFSIVWNKKQAGMHHSLNTEFKKGMVPWNKGKKHSEKTISKLKKSWTPERKQIHKERMRLLRERKGNEICWKHTSEYKKWRKFVFKRDNYTCQFCRRRGGKLNADHIKPQSLFPELRFDVNNGRTLCRNCHKKTITWGIGVYNLRMRTLLK